MLNPILTTVFYETVPEELRSRVGGASTASVLLTAPLGGLAAGFLVERTGLTATLLTIGGVYFLASVSPLVFPAWRGMDAPRAAPGAIPSAARAHGPKVSRSEPLPPGPGRGPGGTSPRR